MKHILISGLLDIHEFKICIPEYLKWHRKSNQLLQ